MVIRVRVPSKPLEVCMIINFRTSMINQNTRKLAQTPILIIIKNNKMLTNPIISY